ncbi:MAG: 3-oxoacyl-ACP reductase FabG [Bacteroidetes bacterium]|nr:MAG: 3-oxoacyl-ACP reductase FabG [Bacteroidota bacterium]RLD73568.1 MAG: 3-oxoacyl-ACP reductase FabG [Bacteroidota bacterium]RLD88649.1 MAG: 3-oxoacyl-ACP reductase FabG [Bacteroidota bacterium]
MKYALVTGGSGGIGKAICHKLAQMGYPVIIHYNNNKTAALTVKEEIENSGNKAELMSFDVTDTNRVKTTLEEWKQEHEDDYIAVLVNNAGTSKDELLVWMEKDTWASVIDTNLNSFYNVTSGLLKDMITSKFGRIINVVSLSGQKGLPGQTNYAAAKAGVIGATKALAQEVGKKKVTVNAVAPGYIKTEMTQGLDEKELKKLIPANRFGTPEEVAETVGFLASEGASYITGEVIKINGGLYT